MAGLINLTHIAAVIFAVAASVIAQDGSEVLSGTPPREIQEEVQPLLGDLRQALSQEDEDAVNAATRRIVEAMGPWAGSPEVAPHYYKPVERETPEIEKVWRLWREIDRRTRHKALWLKVPDGHPRRMTNGLRDAARPVIAYSVLSRLESDRREEYVRLVREGADYLLRIQRKNGLFPFPDLRGRHQLFGPMVEETLRQKPEAYSDGWIIDDVNGELQYDNAICGVAMIHAYEVTNNRKYLDSARRASDWAREQPLSTNWNYNAFRVWLLARYAQVGGGKEYLDAALQALKVGVRPGQMQDGRWLDPHNARLVYHGIIVRGMLEAYRALDAEEPFRPQLRDSLVRALDNAALEIRRNGASSISTTTEMFSLGLAILGSNEQWEEALAINVNAGLHATDDERAPNVGIHLPHYLLYRTVRGE